MAHVKFNLDKALNKEAYAYNCWVDKKYEKNSMTITNEELQKIEDRWGTEKVNSWKNEAEKDYTEYEISDEEFDFAKLESEKTTKTEVENKTGENSTKVQKGRNTANIVGGALSFAGAATGAGFAIAGGIGGGIGSAAAFIITCPLALAVGALYKATKPNKKPYEALMELKTLMENSSATLKQNQEELQVLGNKVANMAAESESEQERKQQEVNVKAQILMYATIVQNEIQNKVNAGEPLTSSEKSMFKESSKQIETLAKEVDMLTGNLITNSANQAGEISSVSGEFDQKALNIATALGQADFAASFDEATKNLAIAQIAMQSANAVAGTSGAIAAMVMSSSPFTFWTLAFAAMGFTGAGLSISGVIEQTKFKRGIEEEIGIRENLQAEVNESLNLYSLNINKMVVSEEVAKKANTLENTERFEEALAQSESMTVQVTPKEIENPTNSTTNNPFLSTVNQDGNANPFTQKPKLQNP